MTAVGMVETDTAIIGIKPFFHTHIMSGSSISYNGLPFQKPKSMMEKAQQPGCLILFLCLVVKAGAVYAQQFALPPDGEVIPFLN